MPQTESITFHFQQSFTGKVFSRAPSRIFSKVSLRTFLFESRVGTVAMETRTVTVKLKGATKLYFVHFLPILLKNLIFLCSVFCFELEVIFIDFLKFCNCRPTGWLYSPVPMRNSSWKKSHNFRRLLLSSIFYN